MTRIDAFHRIGTSFDGQVSIEQALEQAGLARWNVRSVPITTSWVGDHPTDDMGVEFPGQRGVLRNVPGTSTRIGLGVVGARFTHIQNEDAFAFGSDLIGEGYSVDAVGIKGEGQQVWMLFHTGREIKVGEQDLVTPYLLVSTAHDGSGGVKASFTTVRVRCSNAVSMTHLAAQWSVTLRHSANVHQRMAEAVAAQRVTDNGIDTFLSEAERMFDTPVSDQDWNRIVRALTGPKPADSEGVRRVNGWTRKVDALHDTYAADTQDGIRGTAWGAYNALVEYADHHAPGNKDRLALRAMSPAGEAWKRKAARIVLEVAGA